MYFTVVTFCHSKLSSLILNHWYSTYPICRNTEVCIVKDFLKHIKHKTNHKSLILGTLKDKTELNGVYFYKGPKYCNK